MHAKTHTPMLPAERTYDMEFKYKITVFTPTYNRAYIIENLYRSLCRQTYRDFEWLVVDDGSTDSTEQLFQRLMGEADFPIQYYKKENGGKGRAINYGVDFAKGELFFNVDSDDYLTDDALEKVAAWESTIAGDDRFCGVVGNLGTSADYTPNRTFDGEYRDASLLERYKEYSSDPIDGERAYVFYTNIQKKYRYPEFDGEKFITPGIPWNRMAHDGYLVRVFNDIIWIYEYLPDGLSMDTGKFMKNPKGHGLCIKEKAVFFGYNNWEMFKFYYSAYCEFREHYHWKQIAGFVDAPKAVMWLCNLLFSIKHHK